MVLKVARNNFWAVVTRKIQMMQTFLQILAQETLLASLTHAEYWTRLEV